MRRYSRFSYKYRSQPLTPRQRTSHYSGLGTGDSMPAFTKLYDDIFAEIAPYTQQALRSARKGAGAYGLRQEHKS